MCILRAPIEEVHIMTREVGAGVCRPFWAGRAKVPPRGIKIEC